MNAVIAAGAPFLERSAIAAGRQRRAICSPSWPIAGFNAVPRMRAGSFASLSCNGRDALRVSLSRCCRQGSAEMPIHGRCPNVVLDPPTLPPPDFAQKDKRNGVARERRISLSVKLVQEDV